MVLFLVSGFVVPVVDLPVSYYFVLYAPKLEDKANWAPRIASGIETLYHSALNGKGVMPPKGGNMGLADDDVKAAVDYMVSQAQ